MIISIKKIMLLGAMISCLALLLYSMPEAQLNKDSGNSVQTKTKEIAKIDF